MANSKFDLIVEALNLGDSKLPSLLLEESDKRLAIQVGLLTAGDARANGLLAVASTFSAAGIAVAADNTGVSGSAVLFWTAIGFSLMATSAALLAAWALWPCKIDIPGWDPAAFVEDARTHRPLSSLRVEMAALLQLRLDQNRLTLTVLGWRTRLAVCALAASPISAAAFGLFNAGRRDLGGAILAILGAGTLFLVAKREYEIRKQRRKSEDQGSLS